MRQLENKKTKPFKIKESMFRIFVHFNDETYLNLNEF